MRHTLMRGGISDTSPLPWSSPLATLRARRKTRQRRQEERQGRKPMRPTVRAFARHAAIVTIALGILGQNPQRAAAAENWDLYIYNPVATVSAVKGMNVIIEQIEKETNGELKVRLHLGGSLPINTTTITQAVSDDVVQMGDDGYFTGNVPIGGILRLPMLIRSRDEYAKAAAVVDPYLETAFGKKGLVVLGQYLYPFQVAYSRNKLTSLADFKGQKIRVTSPEQGELIKRLGAVPVTLGAPEVPSALDRGVVDGVLTANTGGGNTWKDLLKYNYRIGVNYFNSVVIANKERFAKLPPEVQAKVRTIVKDNMPLISAAMENDEDNLTRKFAEGGMTVTEPTQADQDEAAKIIASFWDDWAKTKGPDAASAVKQVRAALGR
jgi:TRAP-type C4-dicarboxylate transport system substrate-binding protein